MTSDGLSNSRRTCVKQQDKDKMLQVCMQILRHRSLEGDRPNSKRLNCAGGGQFSPEKWQVKLQQGWRWCCCFVANGVVPTNLTFTASDPVQN